MSATINLIGDTSAINVIVDFANTWNDAMRPQLNEQHCYSGTTKTFNFTINENGVAKSLVGLTVGFGVRTTPDPTSPLLLNYACSVVDSVNSVVSVTTGIGDLAAGSYVGELAVHGPAYRDVALQFPLIVDQSLGI